MSASKLVCPVSMSPAKMEAKLWNYGQRQKSKGWECFPLYKYEWKKTYLQCKSLVNATKGSHNMKCMNISYVSKCSGSDKFSLKILGWLS